MVFLRSFHMSIVRILSYWLLAVGLFFGQMESGHALFNNSKLFHSSKELENDDEKTLNDEKKVTQKNETIEKDSIFESEQDKYVVIIKKPLEEDEETASANFQKQIMEDYVGTFSAENQNFIGNDREEEGLEPEKLESQKKQETTTTNSSQQLANKVFVNENEKNINEGNSILADNLQIFIEKKEDKIKEKSKNTGDDGVLKAYEVFDHKGKTIDFNEWKKFVLQNKSNQKACQEATNRMAAYINAGYLITNFCDEDVLSSTWFGEPTHSCFLQPFAKLPLRLNFHEFKASSVKELVKHLPKLDSLLVTESNFTHIHPGKLTLRHVTMAFSFGVFPVFYEDYHYSDMDSIVEVMHTYCPHLKQLGLGYSVTENMTKEIQRTRGGNSGFFPYEKRK